MFFCFVCFWFFFPRPFLLFFLVGRGITSIFVIRFGGTSAGQIVEPSILYSIASSKIGQTFQGRWILESADSTNFNHLKFRGPRQLLCSVDYTSGYSCNPPNEIDPNTGICTEPDVDEGWCESDEYNEELFEYEQWKASQHPNHHTIAELIVYRFEQL